MVAVVVVAVVVVVGGVAAAVRFAAFFLEVRFVSFRIFFDLVFLVSVVVRVVEAVFEGGTGGATIPRVVA